MVEVASNQKILGVENVITKKPKTERKTVAKKLENIENTEKNRFILFYI